MIQSFQIAAGSVPGRDHLGRGNLLVGRNNQDAHAWSRTDAAVVAVVCDGCGSGKHSEVGAALGARLAVRALGCCLASARAGEPGPDGDLPPPWLERARLRVLAHLHALAAGMGGSVEEVVADYFLFTVVGAILTPDWCWLFSIGDGVLAVNGEVTELGPFPNNEPPYLAYPLCGPGPAQAPDADRFRVQHCLPAASVRSILLGTDGVTHLIEAAGRPVPGKTERVGPLRRFWEEDRYFRNPDALRRQLARINSEYVRLDRTTGDLVREPGLLPDDTTLLVLRRKPEGGPVPWTST